MESFSLLQASILLTGIAWKLREGYPILNVPDFSRLFEREVGVPRLYTWLDLFTGASVESLLNDWPWFSLHLFLYVGQLFPLIIIVINEWPFRTRALTAVRYGRITFIYSQLYLVAKLTISPSQPQCSDGLSVYFCWVRSDHASHLSLDTSQIQTNQTLPQGIEVPNISASFSLLFLGGHTHRRFPSSIYCNMDSLLVTPLLHRSVAHYE